MAVAYVDHDDKRIAGSAGTSIVVPRPAGVADADLLVCMVQTAANTITAPAGWTALRASAAATGSAGVLGVWWKLAASEGSSYTFTFSSDQSTAQIIAYRGVDQTTPIGDLAQAADASFDTTFTTPTTTPTHNGMAVMMVTTSFSLFPTYSSPSNGFTLRHSGFGDASCSDDGASCMGSADKAAVAAVATGATALTSNASGTSYGVQFVVYEPFTTRRNQQMLV